RRWGAMLALALALGAVSAAFAGLARERPSTTSPGSTAASPPPAASSIMAPPAKPISRELVPAEHAPDSPPAAASPGAPRSGSLRDAAPSPSASERGTRRPSALPARPLGRNEPAVDPFATPD